LTDQPSLPPFSGDEPTCAKCGKVGAITQYLAYGTCHHEAEMIIGVELNERLHRACERCEYAWDEATVPCGIAPETLPEWEREYLEQQTPERQLQDARTTIDQARRVTTYWHDKAMQSDLGSRAKEDEDGAVAHACAMILDALRSASRGADTLAQIGLPVKPRTPDQGGLIT
jgi:predicted nucleic-acid-binding Zn-ribbon protein